MKIGLVQYAPVWENPEASAKKLAHLLDSAEAVDLLIFPEMSLTGFTMEPGRHAEGENGTGMRFFAELAKRRGVNVIAGLIEKSGEDIFNSLMLWGRNGAPVARYRKIHPFSFAGEDEFYSAGRDPVVAPVEGEPFGFSICYDLRFPELYRLCALRSATVMINIANWPAKRAGHWRHLLKARAIENQCYMIGVNRTGSDPSNEYNGCSAVYDPVGDEVVCAGGEEKIIVAELDMERVGKARSRMPVLNDIKLIAE